MSFIAFLANPAFWAGAAKVGSVVAPGIGSYFGSKGKGGDDEDLLKRISTMSPEQQEVMKKFGPYITGKIGQGLPGWEGKFAAPLSKYEEMGLSRLGEYLEGGIGETAQMGLGAYQQALKGMSPKEVQDWYMEFVAPGEKRYMEQTILPSIREEHVPTGTYWGSPRYGDVERAWGEFGAGQLGRMGEAIMSEREGARSMIPYLSEMEKLEAGVPQMEAAAKYGALPRLIEQTELLGQIQEFIRTTPEMNPILQLAMDFLGTTTMAAYQPGGGASPFAEMMSSIMPGLGDLLGSWGKKDVD